jgi:phosphoenolpyruvate carboxykinase (GTP)
MSSRLPANALADAACEAAGLTNPHVRDFVREWTSLAAPARVEVIDARDEDRLIAEALAAGEISPVSGGRYYARSYVKDTARTEERTFVATSNPNDKGAYNNWRLTSEVKPVVVELMRGASANKTTYVIPYLMAPPGSPLEAFAAGVELTDNRVVVLHMIRMARVGVALVNNLADPSSFVRGVNVVGDLPNLGQGTPADKRHFVTIADERLLLHFGSSYGGNALLGKIAHGLRQASYDGHASGKFLAEQFMLISIRDTIEGTTRYICGGFPSASGKTNLAMMRPPAAFGDRYEVKFFGDDIAWLYVDDEGTLRAFNAEYGVFGVARNSNPGTNPNAIESIGPGSGALFTNVAYNETTKDVWWEGLTPEPPSDLAGWRDWRGELLADRPAERQRSAASGDEWAHPNSRFTTLLANVPNISAEANDPRGVPIDAIIFGGRVRDREPLIRALRNLADGVYDGLTLGAEATAAAEGKEGLLRYDPMSMRPFMSYAEGDYAAHWLKIIGAAKRAPIFAHVNWFRRDASGGYLWPGYGENLRPLLWLLNLAAGRVSGVDTAIGILPRPEELQLDGVTLSDSDRAELFAIDSAAWRREVAARSELLAGFARVPAAISEAHERLEKRLNP